MRPDQLPVLTEVQAPSLLEQYPIIPTGTAQDITQAYEEEFQCLQHYIHSPQHRGILIKQRDNSAFLNSMKGTPKAHQRHTKGTYNPSHSKLSGTHCTHCDIIRRVSRRCLDRLEFLCGLRRGRSSNYIVCNYSQLVKHKWNQPSNSQCRGIRIRHLKHRNPRSISRSLSLKTRSQHIRS